MKTRDKFAGTTGITPRRCVLRLHHFEHGSTSTILAKTSIGGLGTIGFNINEHIGIEAEFGGYHTTDSWTLLMTTPLARLALYGRTTRVDPYFHFSLGESTRPQALQSNR